MFLIQKLDGGAIAVDAFSFELTSGHVVFYDGKGNKVGFYNMDKVESIFKQNVDVVI